MPHTGEKTTPAEALPVLGKDRYLHPQHAVHVLETDNLISIFWFTSENTVFKNISVHSSPWFSVFKTVCSLFVNKLQDIFPPHFSSCRRK